MAQNNVELNFWQILMGAKRFSNDWHKMLMKIHPHFLDPEQERYVPEEDRDLYKMLVQVIGRYRPGDWQAHVDKLEDGSLAGWAKKKGDDSSQFVSLAIQREKAYEWFLAMAPRKDVKAAGIGTGLYGFDVAVNLWDIHAPFFLAEILDPETGETVAFKILETPEGYRQ